MGSRAGSFITKQNDTKPIEAVLKDRNGRVDLTGASVKFLMQDLSGNQIVDAAATVTDASSGEVEYEFDPTETDEDGEFEGEFEVTTSGGIVKTFPHDGYIDIVILEDRG